MLTHPKGGEANSDDDKTDSVHDEGHGVVILGIEANVRAQYLIVEVFHINHHALSV